MTQVTQTVINRDSSSSVYVVAVLLEETPEGALNRVRKQYPEWKNEDLTVLLFCDLEGRGRIL